MEKKLVLKKHYLFRTMFMFVIILAMAMTGCNGSGSSDSSSKTGYFIDSHIEGLSYECGSLSGETEEDGKFKYQEGETIFFTIGGVALGEKVEAKEIMTPADLISNADSYKDQEVLNILVFLQTLDSDNDPENGIKITAAISGALLNKTLEFNQSSEDFNVDAQILIDQIFTDSRLLVTGADAQDHMKQSILAMVTTTRDDKGVWFIKENAPGADLYSVFEAMGYNVATDRLWQAELYRRAASGRLAEIFGSDFLTQDILARTTGYSDAELESGFDGLDKETRIIITAYVDGFNRRLDEINANPQLLPFEFAAMGITPEAWTTDNILSWMSTLLRQFDCEATDPGQIDNLSLLNELQTKYPTVFMDMFNDLRWVNDPEALTYIPDTSSAKFISGTSRTISSLPSLDNCSYEIPDLRKTAQKIKRLYRERDENLQKINAKVKMGSYAWVISKDRTQSKNPIIYSGPQMGFTVPSIVLEGSIEAAGLNVSGMSVTGIPGIVIGRTPHHAWSMQVGHSHTVDYYIETPSDVDPVPVMETIKVAGESDITIPLWKTSHGPVINPVPYDPSTYDYNTDGPIISWRYANKDHEFTTLKGFLGLARAEDMDSFGNSIEEIGLSQHFCYADKDGNIAYWMSGFDPVRPAAGDYRLPQGALGQALDWDETVLKTRSTDRNTSQGFYCGWNNKTNKDYADSYNSFSYKFGPFNRAQVIHDYLAAHDNLTFEEVRDLAANIASTDTSFTSRGGSTWKFIDYYFTAAVNIASTDDRLDALAMFDDYDGHFVSEGMENWTSGTDRADAWVLLDAWIDKVMELTFKDELGDELYSDQNTNILFNVLLHGLAGTGSGVVNNYNWFANEDTSAPQTAEDIIVTALDQVLADLGTKPWGTGTRTEIEFTHDMIGKVHSIPYACRSTYAHCVEYGDSGPVRIESMFPLGESGNILMGSGGVPEFDDNFYSMTPVYDYFAHREFSLFEN